MSILLLTALMIGGVSASSPVPAGADTDPATLSGQGSAFLEPVLSKLLVDDAPNLSPLFGAYLQTDLNAGISSFVGSAPGQFTADYAVTERPLTSAEASQAKTDGRSYAYVPFAATPVAIATLVPTNAWAQSGSTSISPSGFCQHIPLNATQLGQIFGYDAASPLQNWGDARITCPASSGTMADDVGVSTWANLDPSMENYALMALLDSTPQSQTYFAAGLANFGSLTSSTSPSENWPYGHGTIPGGDQPLIGTLLAIDPQTNVPSSTALNWKLGATGPISSVWIGSPIGVPWNISTAAVQNAEGAYVPPSLKAATAAASDSTSASTSDPTTNNLVTFNATTSDSDAYNSYLMEESYLLVPLNGLSANKASALAQFVRFVLGPLGQQDIENFGAAPATAAEQTAGLKVAAELSASAVASPNPAVSTGSTSTGSTSTTSPGAGSSTTGTSAPPSSATDASSGGAGGATDSTSGGLAFTGTANLGIWVGVGTSLFVFGTILRRRLRHRPRQREMSP